MLRLFAVLQAKERSKTRAQKAPNKHLPMLWSVFEESKEAKVKSGVDTWNRLALELQGDKPKPKRREPPILYEPITTSVDLLLPILFQCQESVVEPSVVFYFLTLVCF